jgi:nucleotide-binding universal stress UspA family protein
VGVDGSVPSLHALRRAVRSASLLDASVTAVAVWQFPAAVFDGSVAPAGWSPEEDTRAMLAASVASVVGENPPDWFSAQVREGLASRVLIDESADADLLVLGSRGHGGFVGLLLGSVSATCSQYATCPVLVVHEPASQADTEPVELPRITRLVVGVDGSAPSTAALRRAVELAPFLKSTVLAVTAWQYPVTYAASTIIPQHAQLERSPEDSAHRVADSVAREVFNGVVPDWFRSVARHGAPARVLIDASGEGDLLVVGSRGRGGFSGLLLGSVSTACAEYARCPVVIFHTVDTPR